jgi:glucosamine-6-phosphate deaminase
MNQSIVSQMEVWHYPSRKELGKSVAEGVASCMKTLLTQKETISVAFASAPSQNEFLDALRADTSIQWGRIVCFHLDEYIGLSEEAPQSFSNFLRKKLFNLRVPKQFHAINGMNNSADECERYSQLLQAHPLDIACIGIGENGHIAFNDPHAADFKDPLAVKVVKLDEASRMQQVHDVCFETYEQVPSEAVTLTIPTILSASLIFCTVPGKRKRDAVRKTLYGPIDVQCPASLLRQAKCFKIYLDDESYSTVLEDL